MRAAHMVLAFALLAGLAGCRKGPQGDTGPRRTSGAKGRYGTGGSARPPAACESSGRTAPPV